MGAWLGCVVLGVREAIVTVAGTPPQEQSERRSSGRGRESNVRGVDGGCRRVLLSLALLAATQGVR